MKKMVLQKTGLLRSLFIIGNVTLFSPFLYADTPTTLSLAQAPILDKVAFQMTSRLWVKTNTALVSIHINATLNNADLLQARADILARLHKIAAGEWQLVQFERSQDSSGLEKLFVDAQARVAQNSLTDIYKNAKEVSKPGAVYTVNSIDFKPSSVEIQQAKAGLRQRLYQMVSQEIARLNKAYPAQSYSLNSLYFYEGDAPVMAPQMMGTTLNKVAYSGPRSTSEAELPVSNELMMTAAVEAASSRVGK